MDEARSFFEDVVPVAKQSLVSVLLRSDNDKLVSEVSTRILEAAGRMQPTRGVQQIIITDSDVKLLNIGIQEVLNAERNPPKG